MKLPFSDPVALNKYLDQFREVNTLPSCVVPDETYSIPELFIRAQQGFPITDKSSDAVYNEDYHHPSEDGDYDLSDYDTDIRDIRSRAKQRAEDAKRTSAETESTETSGAQRSEATQASTDSDGFDGAAS